MSEMENLHDNDNEYLNQEPNSGSKKRTALVGFIAAAAVLVIVLGVIFLPKLFTDEKTKVMNSMEKVSSSMQSGDSASVFSYLGLDKISERYTTGAMQTKISLIPISLGDESIDEYLSGFELSGDFLTDAANDKFASTLTLKMMGSFSTSVNMYKDENEFQLAAPLFYDGYLTMPLKDFVEKYQSSFLNDNYPIDADAFNEFFSNQGYLEQLKHAADEAGNNFEALYESITLEELETTETFTFNGKEETCTPYQFTVPGEELSEILNTYIDVFASLDIWITLVGYDLSTSEIEEMKADVTELFQDDIVLTAYMTASNNLAAIDIETKLTSEDKKLHIDMHVEFEGTDYNAAYNGQVELTLDGETAYIDFNKQNTSEDKKHESVFELHLRDVTSSEAVYICESSFDESSNEFMYKLTFDVDDEAFVVGAEGTLEDYKSGESFSLAIDRLYLETEYESVEFSATLDVSPLEDSIEALTGTSRDILEMSEDDFNSLFEEIQTNLQMTGLYN